ncbi:hypothetical protein FSP39_000163 [Pinctada imbricata]|uniref:A disintegrin and metalloproteinase with thrombospondin motifs 7 n=1 Tax=Pinctada imbricata TaxID=66713 RepID=A0AA88Y143_PINIB|nr:hypothetical protein FSP39_000163 [Pinctada imbricata]
MMPMERLLLQLFWIVLFLLFILPMDIASLKYSINDHKQEKFVKSLDSYDVSVPTRVTRDGDFLSHILHPHHTDRYKRSSQRTNSDVHYKLNLNNQEIHVSLLPNDKLYYSSFVIERRENIYGNITDSTFEKYVEKNSKPCHYIGEVIGQPFSKVALETCNGLKGLIHTGEQSYFIEPIKGHNFTLSPHHPHIIYKSSSQKSSLLHPDFLDTQAHKQSCGTSDPTHEEIIKQRERWEAHHLNKRSTSHRRHKRSISVERHVETMVVVDPSMMDYYKEEDVTTYVLTIMNMVASLYHDASIGNAINIVIVRLVLLKAHQDDLKITHHADKTLRSFCRWQKSINIKDEDHPNHHDVAVLLTRKDICARMNEPCGTLGLAQIAGVCQPHRSCSINEDTGLALAYTVAHELGHNFGMRHDTALNGCDIKENDVSMTIMSAHLLSISPLMKWSNCSKRAITDFIDRGWAYCLDDEPARYRNETYNYPVLPPGTMYDADHQCRLAYGPEAYLCEGGKDDICHTLWCRVNNKCSTKLEAAAEGTICDTNKWCFNEKCVLIGERPEAINGNWGEWSSWSSCSRTCGAGVSVTERHCDNPRPSNGGKYCIGERKRYKICNTDSCPERSKSFRLTQCEEFNKIPYKNRKYEWTDVPMEQAPCQLHCKPKNKFFSVMLRDMVTDGTPCTPGTRNMCISGRCRHIGCDWGIDSPAKEDRCGVCHGDGSTCETIKDQYNETQGVGYVEARIIPKDARNIRIEEVAEANNYLAVQNDKGEYYLNGHWFIQWSGDYEMAGTIVHYQRTGNKERVEARGPLTEPLHIMLLLQAENPGVSFEYTVPKENATDTRPRDFQWKHMDWTHCTSSCGGGSQRSVVVCVESETGTVDDFYCNSTVKPDDIQRACNLHLCPARWWAGPWQHCSVTCGDNGVHRRTVMCVRSLGSDEQIALEDRSCQSQQKPTEVEKCRHKDPCPGTASWVVGDWFTCGENPCSNQTRPVTCELPHIGCFGSAKPVSSRSCSNLTCGNWQFDEWSKCSKSCGTGNRYRKVHCKGSHICDLTTRPINNEKCNDFECPTTTTISTVGTTKQASLETSTTLKLRESTPSPMFLYDVEEETRDSRFEIDDSSNKVSVNRELNDINKKGESKDTNTEEVVIGGHTLLIEEGGTENLGPERKEFRNAQNHLKTSEEDIEGEDLQTTSTEGPTTPVSSQKSAKNDSLIALGRTNQQHGEKSTINTASKAPNFPPLKQLPTVPLLHRRPLPKLPPSILRKPTLTNHIIAPSIFEWVPKNWTECSRHCGGGVQTRTVVCVNSKSGTETTTTDCNILTKPNAIQTCNPETCTDWEISDWSPCSVTCDEGVQQREVKCPVTKKCDKDIRPSRFQSCRQSACIAWIHGQWTKCSKSCGGGKQIRLVKCVNITSQLETSGCHKPTKPEESATCNEEPCPEQKSELTESTCRRNRMSDHVCRLLKRRRHCHRLFVRINCCRTCELDKFRKRRPRGRSDR